MARDRITVELEDTDHEKLNKIAADQNVNISELVERLVASHLESKSLEAVRSPGDPAELFKWEEQKGALIFTPTNKRVFIVNAHAWGLIEQDLLVHFLKGASPLLSEMGAAYGVAIALDYRSVTGEPENVASYFELLGQTAGWGKFSLSGDLAKGSKITVSIHNCVFCGTRNPSAERNDQCYFIMGVCKGIADAVFGFPHSVHETKCYARGNDLCEIVIGTATDSEEAVWPPGPNPMTGASWSRPSGRAGVLP